jgi:3-oxoadipate CoA-transferase alpha subunit
VHAFLADYLGNLSYALTARNFNPLMAMAAARTIAQASQIVQPGGIDPESVVTPGIFVQGVVEVPDPAQEEDLNRADARYPEAAQAWPRS